MTTAVILGTPCSGGSLVAALLHKAGFFLGRVFDAPLADNAFCSLNRQVMAHLDSSEESLLSRIEILAALPTFEAKIARLIAVRSQQPLWAWRDVLNAQTVWLYHDLLTEPHYIIVRRNRSVAAASLRTWYPRWSLSRCFEVTDHYRAHLKAFRRLHGDRVLVVDYEAFCDPVSRGREIFTLMQFVGVTGYDTAALMQTVREV